MSSATKHALGDHWSGGGIHARIRAYQQTRNLANDSKRDVIEELVEIAKRKT